MPRHTPKRTDFVFGLFRRSSLRERLGGDVVAAVISRDGQFGLQNVSQEVWKCRTSTGEDRELPPGIQVKLTNGGFSIV